MPPIHPSLAPTAAFVHQKELLYGYLTPREHLIFHAHTRMSRDYSREALLARVEEVGPAAGRCLPACFILSCPVRSDGWMDGWTDVQRMQQQLTRNAPTSPPPPR